MRVSAPPAPAPPIDPRIRARRIEVRRDAGRRRLRRLVDLGLVVLVAAGFVVALRSPLLDVDEVVVRGAVRTDPTAISAEAGVVPGDQLADVDLGAVGRRVAALPWVGEVTVRRGLGGTVVLEVVEREAAAVVGEGAAAVVVDPEGRALALASSAPDLAEVLVRVEGLPADGLAPGAFLPAGDEPALALARQLADVVPGAVTAVVPGPDLQATLAAGGTVRFGDGTALAAKLRSLATVLEQVDLTCLGVLDVRTPGSPVLTRREPCS